MLTPRSDDPNKAEQKKVKAENPEKFGASHEEQIKAKLKDSKSK